MNPTGKPMMGVQAVLQQSTTHANNGVNMINNNVPQNFTNSSRTLTIKSPVVITTPPSPQVPVKNLPAVSPLTANCASYSSGSGTTVQTPVPSTTVSSTLSSGPSTVVTSVPNSVSTLDNSRTPLILSTTPSKPNTTITPQIFPAATVTSATSAKVDVHPTRAPSGVCSTTSAIIDKSAGTGVASTTENISTSPICAVKKGTCTTPTPVPQGSVTPGVDSCGALSGSGIRGGGGTRQSTSSPKSTSVVVNKDITPSSINTSQSGLKSETGTCPAAAVQQSPIPITTSKPTSSTGFGVGPNFNEHHQPSLQKSGGVGVTNNQISCSSPVTETRPTTENTGAQSRNIEKITSSLASGFVKMDGQQGAKEAEETNANSKGPTLIPAQSSVSMESNGSYSGVSESDSDVHPQAPPKTASRGGAGKLLEGFGDEIGDDVRLVVTLLENSGLCGPMTSSSSSSRPGTAGSDIIPPARPSTAEKPYNLAEMGIRGDKNVMKDNGNNSKPMKSPDTKIGNYEELKGNSKTPTTKTRPPSGSSRSRPNTGTGVGAFPSPVEKNKDKTPKQDIPGSEKVSGEPNLSRIGRSTPRAASAKANATTTQIPTSTLGEHIKSPRTPRSKSGSGTQELNARPKSALPTSATPRSRPSSTLYQHTASSAQKGILAQSPATPSGGSVIKATPSPNTPKGASSRPSTRPRTSGVKMGDPTAGAAGDSKPHTLTDQFAAFSRFGDTASDGKHITLSNSDKWMKQAKVIDGKKVTTTDTSITFKKLFKTTKKVPLDDFKRYVEELAKSKKIEPQELLDKLTNCGPPGLSSSTKAAHAGVVERLTDTSKYTGSHKERFDSTGKGKGIEGRRDVADSSGYVASFKDKLDLNKDTPVKGGSPNSTPVPTKESSPAPAK